MQRRVGLVLAGAAARGAYEAGALSVLLPALESRGERPTVLVGTSAGALNATFLAGRADVPADVATKELVELWLGIERKNVFDYSLFALPALIGQELGLGRRPSGLVDTGPLQKTLDSAMGDWGRIGRNIAAGSLDALAVVTTATSTGRTVVFVEGGGPEPGGQLPETDHKKGIDYLTPLGGMGSSHVLASAAIPLLFPPIDIMTADGRSEWFVDGGLRLNTPIKPALELGVDRVLIVAADPARHAEPGEPANPTIPDIDDLLLHFLQAALADPLIEDMWRLAGVNTLLGRAASDDGKRPVGYVFVGPARRGELGREAGRVADDLGPSGFRALSWLLGRQGSQHEELLSYLLFEPAFFEAAIERGIADARLELAALADEGLDWRTDPLPG